MGHGNRRGDGERAAADLGDPVPKARGQIDAGAMLGAGDRVADRLAAGLDMAFGAQAGASRIDIDCELDGRVERLVDLRNGGGEDLKVGRAGLGLAPGDDLP